MTTANDLSTDPQGDSTDVEIADTTGSVWRRFATRQAIQDFGLVVVLVVMGIVFAMVAPNFLTSDNLINVLQQLSVTAIAAVGATLVILVGGIDLSSGSVLALTGTVAALYLQAHGNGIGTAVVAVIIAVAIGGGAGTVNGIIVTRLRVTAFIATLATQTALAGVALLVTNSYPVSINNQWFISLGTGHLVGIPTPVVVMLVMFVLGWLVLKRTTTGRRIYAVGGNLRAARLSGIRPNRTIMFVYVAAGLAAGLAGAVLAGRLASGQPAGSTGFELQVIAAVVVGGTSLAGGRGRMSGTFIGAVVLGVLTNGLTLMNVQDYWQMIVNGAVIVGAIAVDSKLRGDTGA